MYWRNVYKLIYIKFIKAFLNITLSYNLKMLNPDLS